MNLSVVLSPAEIALLPRHALDESICVVFDVLRATSTMLAALHAGAAGIQPVSEIAEAVAIKARQPDVLLAGEREGRRITAALSGAREFDLGNSPREMTPERVAGRLIVTTTTNGTRAIRACAHARGVIIAGFVNLTATADWLTARDEKEVILICSGTGEETCWEDVLGAGALINQLADLGAITWLADSAILAQAAYRAVHGNLKPAAQQARNARRLLAIPDLADDVDWCLEVDRCPLVAILRDNGVISPV